VVSEITCILQGPCCCGYGCGIENIMLDPGIGFGKTLEHNLEILRRLSEFRGIGCPVLAGASVDRS